MAGCAHRALADAEIAASLLVHLELELRGRFKVSDVSHELLSKIQIAPKAKLAHCLKWQRNFFSVKIFRRVHRDGNLSLSG